MSPLLEAASLLDSVKLPHGSAQKIADVADDHTLHGSLGPRLREVGPEQVHRDHRLDARVVVEPLEFAGRVERARLDDDGPGAPGAEHRDEEVGRVRQEQGDPVSGSDAQLAEAMGKAVRGRIQAWVRQARLDETDRDPIGESLRGGTEHLGHRGFRILD